MPGSVTVRLPSPRRVIWSVLTFVAVGALLMIGITVGNRLFAADPIQRLTVQGAIQQVGLRTGAVYVGRVIGADGGYVRVADPAIIRQTGADSSASAAPRLVVEGLTAEPYDVAGELVIPVESIEWAAAVRPGSGLEAAYRQAVGQLPAVPVASPS